MRILHEDEHCLAVSKPAGLSTQAPPIAGPTLETEIRAYLDPARTGRVFLGTVHRLDRPVSGVVLTAKTPRAARRLSGQFERRQVAKEYWAIVEGRPADLEGTWIDWLYREDTGLGRVQVCLPGAPRAQQAITRVEVGTPLAMPDGLTWLRLHPETGRMHQLRVQTGARGLPILGDHTYGASRAFPEGIALHARSLTVSHPQTHQPITFQAPIPACWADAGIRLPEF